MGTHSGNGSTRGRTRRRFVALGATLTLALGIYGAAFASADEAVSGSTTTSTGEQSPTSTSSSTTTPTTIGSPTTTTSLPAGPPDAETPDPGSAAGAAAAAAAVDALDLDAQAVADSVTVRTTTHAGDPAGTFTIRLQTCTGSAATCSTNAGGWTDVGTISLAHGGEHTFTGLSAATNKRYRVVEDDVTGWILTGVSGASCTGGSATTPTGKAGGYNFGIWVADSEKDCTFDNANRRVTITKSADAPGEFDIRLQRCSSSIVIFCTGWTDIGGGPGTWSDGTTFEFASLPAANLSLYRAIEMIQEGWRLTALTCSGGGTAPDLSGLATSPPFFGHFFFLTAANPTRSCTFTNEANRITVTKATAPTGAPREFPTRIYQCKVNVLTFCVGGDDVTDPSVWDELESFDLADGGSHDLLHPDATLFDRLYAVVEDAPAPGWTVDVDCSGNLGIGSPVDLPNGQKFTFSAINLSAAAATCAISNTTTTGSITIQKFTNPIGGVDFGFELTDLDDPSGTSTAFSLVDAETRVFTDLFPSSSGGGYRITETSMAPTWSLDNVDCGAALTTPVSDGVVVALAAGANVTCTFENVSPTVPGISMTKTATPSVAQAGDTITYTYRVTNTGPVPVSDLTVVDDPLGPVLLDLTSLAPAGTPGDTATGTLTRPVTTADIGQVIVNVATAQGFVACNVEAEDCSPTGDSLSVTPTANVTAVTATATASVSVIEIAGASATRSSSSGNLASTGSSPTPAIIALGLIAVGALFSGVRRTRRRGLDA